MNIVEEKCLDHNLIKIDNGVLKVTFSSFGAGIYSIIFNEEEMLLTPKNIEDFLSTTPYGKINGRIVNRVKEGIVVIDDLTYQLPLNENENTYNCGDENINNKDFEYLISSNNLETTITFMYLSRESSQSLPGDVYIKVTYKLKENDSRLFMSIEADSNKRTIVNMNNSLFFSLGSPNLENTKLSLKASRFVHVKRDNMVPLYNVEVPSCLDYRELKPILFDINNLFLQDNASFGVDHHFFFDKVSLRIPNVTLENDKYRLKVYTDFEGTQIYTCNYPDGIEKVTGESVKYEGVCISPQNSIIKRKIDKHFANQVIFNFENK